MASHQKPEQQATIRRVMHEFKHGELESSRGGKVRNPKQAIAVALSEAGASNRQSPEENRRQYRRSKRKEGAGQTAQAETEGRGRAERTLDEGKRRRARHSRHTGQAHSMTGRGADGDGTTRRELYAEAARRGVPGRSRMSKAELAQALR